MRPLSAMFTNRMFTSLKYGRDVGERRKKRERRRRQ